MELNTGLQPADKSTKPVPRRIGAYRLVRLLASLLMMTVASSGMFTTIIVLKPAMAEFGIGHGAGALPYTLYMIGFGFGNVIMGRVADRYGVALPALIGSVCLPLGLYLASQAVSLLWFCLILAVFCGLLGAAFSLGPLVADVSHWFRARRGLAVGLVISGSYLGGAFWPALLQHWVDSYGWRETFVLQAQICALLMLPLTCALYRRPLIEDDYIDAEALATLRRPLGLSRNTLQGCLCVAGIGCCVAMSMPQVHIVPYVTGLGFTPLQGATMLSLMLGFGIFSRITSGWMSDHIGGLKTLILGSVLQALVIIAFLFADTLSALYFTSAAFGLAQGGIVPSYSIIIRRYFPAAEAGWRIGLSFVFTIAGMAFGGWVAGALYDLSGSYTLSFLNAIAFNLLNLAIAASLLLRGRGQERWQPGAAQA